VALGPLALHGIAQRGVATLPLAHKRAQARSLAFSDRRPRTDFTLGRVRERYARRNRWYTNMRAS